jgi:hypothetical protein
MRYPAPLPAPLRAAPFTVTDAASLGLTAKALRSSALRAPVRGIRVSRSLPDDLSTRCRAAALALPADAYFSHLTALRMLSVETPWRLDRDQRLHATIPAGTRPSRLRGLAVHSRERMPDDVRLLGGLRVATPEMTWVQLAGSLSIDEVVVLGDAMTRRKEPHVRLEDLARAVGDCPAGTRGVARLRLSLDLVRPGTDSSMETRTRLLLLQTGLPCPDVNVPVRDAFGNFIARCDMSYAAAKLAIEYDGDIHRTDAGAWRRDVARRRALEAAGWRIITVTADDIRHPERVLTQIRRALAIRLP